jgi:hypothetical protein
MQILYEFSHVNNHKDYSYFTVCDIVPLDSIMESKRKCNSDSEAKKNCKVMTLDEKIKIVDQLRGGRAQHQLA